MMKVMLALAMVLVRSPVWAYCVPYSDFGSGSEVYEQELKNVGTFRSVVSISPGDSLSDPLERCPGGVDIHVYLLEGIPSGAAFIEIFTTGDVDTHGRLFFKSGSGYVSDRADDDGGVDENFRIRINTVNTPSYGRYLVVRGYFDPGYDPEYGTYTLHVRVTPRGTPTPEEPSPPEEPDVPIIRGERLATLLNLSPWQAWVHLYCQKPRSDETPCTVTFECNGMSGEPVVWTVNVPSKTIFSYWPNKTVDGMDADLQAVLMEAGKTEEEARRRTTCEVFSPDPVAVRGYTLFGGQLTLVPVAIY